jgi:hypothetical protein
LAGHGDRWSRPPFAPALGPARCGLGLCSDRCGRLRVCTQYRRGSGQQRRASFRAGARAVLVSHWAVDSAATVKLVTTAINALDGDAGLGRAEAMRHAMVALIETGAPLEAHPSYWAPFVVVGEGAADGGASRPQAQPQLKAHRARKGPVQSGTPDWRSEVWAR